MTLWLLTMRRREYLDHTKHHVRIPSLIYALAIIGLGKAAWPGYMRPSKITIIAFTVDP